MAKEVNVLFELDFENMLKRHAADISDKKKFTALVKDYFPDQAKTMNLLLMAYNMGIADDMQNVAKINNTFAYRFVKQLIDDYGLSRANADWIVSIWCVCYGEKTLGKACDISIQAANSGPAIEAEEQSSSGKKYGDLFTYKQSQNGTGLAVTGFTGDKSKSIIFQNRANNSNVIEIADASFEGCDMEEAIITEGIVFIGNKSFKDCKRLHQAVMPISIKEIGNEAFAGCSSMKSVSLPMLLEKINDKAFAGTGIRNIGIPKSLYFIGEGVFSGCEELTSISIPENIDRITKGMFENCKNLKKVSLHENLLEIGDNAFFGCQALDYIIVPDSVKHIGINAFERTDKRFIIQCSFGSYAEQYCRKNKIKYQLV